MGKRIVTLFLLPVVVVIILVSVAYRFADKEQYVLSESIRNSKGYSFIPLSKGIVHYELSGDTSKPLIVLVHGGTIPMFNFNRQISDFVDAGYSVLRYDQYGRGYSDRPKIEYDRNLYSDLLLELLDSLDFKEPVNLLGHSFGGSTVTHFLTRYPERVNKLILFSPMINGISNMTAFKIVRFPIIGEYVARFLILPLSVKRIEKSFGESKDTINKYVSLFKEQMVYKGFEQSLFSMMKSDAMRDYSYEFNKAGESNNDILLIWGDKDETISKDMIDIVRQYVPFANYVEVRGGTHAFNFNRANEFNKMVIRFLNYKN